MEPVSQLTAHTLALNEMSVYYHCGRLASLSPGKASYAVKTGKALKLSLVNIGFFGWSVTICYLERVLKKHE